MTDQTVSQELTVSALLPLSEFMLRLDQLLTSDGKARSMIQTDHIQDTHRTILLLTFLSAKRMDLTELQVMTVLILSLQEVFTLRKTQRRSQLLLTMLNPMESSQLAQVPKVRDQDTIADELTL